MFENVRCQLGLHQTEVLFANEEKSDFTYACIHCGHRPRMTTITVDPLPYSKLKELSDK